LRIRAWQSDQQHGRWVVQIPVYKAQDLGLLPRGLTPRNFREVLCRTAPNEPEATVQARAAALDGGGWLSKCRGFRWLSGRQSPPDVGR
jgi:hypothetical protein